MNEIDLIRIIALLFSIVVWVAIYRMFRWWAS